MGITIYSLFMGNAGFLASTVVLESRHLQLRAISKVQLQAAQTSQGPEGICIAFARL